MLEIFEEGFEEEVTESEFWIPTEYAIDFENGIIDNEVITDGLESLKSWAILAINTARFRYRIFSWNYGSELEELIGEGDLSEYVESEAERMITDCLTAHPMIEEVSFDSINFEDTTLRIEFTIITRLGDAELSTEMEVN